VGTQLVKGEIMFACCQMCYVKYINEDGTLDVNRYNAEWNSVEEEYKDKNKGKPIYRQIVKPDKPCMCKCHQDGLDVFH